MSYELFGLFVTEYHLCYAMFQVKMPAGENAFTKTPVAAFCTTGMFTVPGKKRTPHGPALIKLK